jgi:hypothetical protein
VGNCTADWPYYLSLYIFFFYLPFFGFLITALFIFYSLIFIIFTA